MDKKTAQYALEFLKRVELKGVEVDAFVLVVRELAKVAGADTAPTEKPLVSDDLHA